MNDTVKKPTKSWPIWIWIVIVVIVTGVIAGYIGYILGQSFQRDRLSSNASSGQETEKESPAPESTVTGAFTIPADEFVVIQRYADSFLKANDGNGGRRYLYASDLMDGIDEPLKADELDDFFLLDVRRPTDYAAGHIRGAVNVQLDDVANTSVLAMLPKDRPILVICYTGHTASIATAVLRILGYDAWTLRFGMISWGDSTPTTIWSPIIKQDIHGGSYPVVAGVKPS